MLIVLRGGSHDGTISHHDEASLRIPKHIPAANWADRGDGEDDPNVPIELYRLADPPKLEQVVDLLGITSRYRALGTFTLTPAYVFDFEREWL